MKKSDKIILLFYIILGVSLISVFSYFDSLYERPQIDLLIPTEPIKKISFQNILNSVSQKHMYDVLTSVDEYPKILPKNILDVKILNQTDNTILSKIILNENIIRMELTTLHTFEPMKTHTIEILDGDAKGTIITQTFEKTGFNDKEFKITTSVDFNLKGVLSAIGFLPKSNLEHALNTVITEFALYSDTKYFLSENEQIVDLLYREILLRPADPKGLKYYVHELNTGKMNIGDVKNSLINSEEYVELTVFREIKTLVDLNPTTKKIINDIYSEILLRPADPKGLQYYGSLLENKEITIKEIRQKLFESEEYLINN